MAANPFPAIPDPGQTTGALVACVAAMRQAVQLLVTAALLPTVKPVAAPLFTLATTAPISPNLKDLWYNPTTAHLYMWVNTGTSNVWLVIG